MQSVKRTHFHRVSNGFSLKSVVTVVRDRNFTPRTITTICITVLYFPHNCTLFSIQHPCYCMENTVHFVPLIRPRKVQYTYILYYCDCLRIASSKQRSRLRQAISADHTKLKKLIQQYNTVSVAAAEPNILQ